jgi:DNA helicase HerA-like ATPase
MFDQENLPPLLPEDLVKPGRVSIIDVSSLTDDQQRVVALYLLSTFATYKTRSQDSTGLLLVMDEAQKLFPHRGDLKKDYAHRLARFVSGIVHRGRRRRYGVVLATQYPSDVSKEVVELCDTKIVFKMSGPIDWLKMTLGGSGFARSASELSVGEAYVVSTGLNIQQPARVRFPAVETSE